MSYDGGGAMGGTMAATGTAATGMGTGGTRAGTGATTLAAMGVEELTWNIEQRGKIEDKAFRINLCDN